VQIGMVIFLVSTAKYSLNTNPMVQQNDFHQMMKVCRLFILIMLSDTLIDLFLFIASRYVNVMLMSVMLRYTFSGIFRKVQMKYQPHGFQQRTVHCQVSVTLYCVFIKACSSFFILALHR